MSAVLDTNSGQQPGSMSENVRQCPIFENHLHEKQLAAIEMLVLGRSFRAITKAIEIDTRTLYRWRKDPEFLEVLNARRREVWGDVVGRLQDLTHSSLEVMAANLEDNYDMSRFRAASLILRLANLTKKTEGE